MSAMQTVAVVENVTAEGRQLQMADGRWQMADGSGQSAAARKCNGPRRYGAEVSASSAHHARMYPFRKINAWRKAHILSVACHRATFRRPRSGTAPGFRSQFLRAVDAIPDNIAEGAGQRSQRQFARYLEIALSSAHEADNHLERAHALRIFDRPEGRRLQEMLWEVKRMLTAFHRAVKRRGVEEETDDTEPDN
jgi:four helix bundle protein